jgi:hypothetical protein
MSVNEYITKFTQLSRYTTHEVNTDEKKLECFLNGLNDGLAYAFEARDFENFQGMVNKALVVKNHRGVMERKYKLVLYWVVVPGPILLRLQLDLCSVLLSHSFSQGHMQLDKDTLPLNVNSFSTPIISRLLLLGVRVFRGPKLPKTHNKLIVSATTMVKRDITPTDAPFHALVPISLL